MLINNNMLFRIATLLLSSCLPLSVQGAPTLILNFDLNGTILAEDSAAGKNRDCYLSEILARRTKSRWEGGLPKEITYFEYLEEKGVPWKTKDEMLCRFSNDYDHYFNGTLKKQEKELSDALDRMDTKIFESFFRLLAHLDSEGLRYRVVLRSFGTDVTKAIEILENKLNIRIVRGEFNNGALSIFDDNKEEQYKNLQEIEEVINQADFLAITDEYEPWSKSGKKWTHGKKFFPSKGKGAYLPLFFDDNVVLNHPDKGIVHPILFSSSGSLSLTTPAELIHNQLFQIDTSEAILDPNYFISLTEKALAIHSVRP